MRVAKRAVKALVMLVLFCVLALVVGYVTERLWNWLMPSIFGLRTITYWQAVGLLVLSKILLGGFHKHGPRLVHDRRWKEKRAWKRRMQERWHEMSDEERDKWRAAMRDKWMRNGERWRAAACGWGEERGPFRGRGDEQRKEQGAGEENR